MPDSRIVGGASRDKTRQGHALKNVHARHSAGNVGRLRHMKMIPNLVQICQNPIDAVPVFS
jgi:hypothetical protein